MSLAHGGPSSAGGPFVHVDLVQLTDPKGRR
jgi:hypothetical protein